MSLPASSQFVSHKQFHQHVNHKKKLSLRQPLPTSFGSFSFFQVSLWLLGVDKVLQKLPKSCKCQLWHLFQCFILIPRKPHFNTQWERWGQGTSAIHDYTWTQRSLRKVRNSYSPHNLPTFLMLNNWGWIWPIRSFGPANTIKQIIVNLR